MDTTGTAFLAHMHAQDTAKLLEAFHTNEATMRNTIAYLAKPTGRDHVMSVKDEEYARMMVDVALQGGRFKGRARDFRGQYFKTIFDDGVVKGWSLRVHKYVLVVPWSFGRLAMVFFHQINKQMALSDAAKASRLHAHEEELTRDFSATIGKRANDRTLNLRPHRAKLNGRRNHFVAVPKVL